MNKHKKAETVIDAENKQVVARGEWVGGGKKSGGRNSEKSA